MKQCPVTNEIRCRPVTCDICGINNAKLLFTAVDRLHGFEGVFRYVQCRHCGLVYMDPQVVPEQLSSFYPADYAPHQVNANAVIAKEKKTSLPQYVLDALDTRSRVLDVGCGSGGFLHQLQQFRKCRVFGVDFSQNAAHTARQQYGLDVIHGRIFDVPFDENSFDLITAWSCLEHFGNPAAAIQKMWSLCKPSGLLLVKTPNIDSFAARWFKDKWYHLDCPRHLYLFSPKTITSLLKKYDFEDIRISHQTSSKGWRGSLQYHFYGDNYRSEVKDKVHHSFFIQNMISPLSHLSAWLKKADTMMITARKRCNEDSDSKP